MMIDMRTLTPINRMVGEDDEDSTLLRNMHNEAKKFLLSFEWCRDLQQSFFGCGIGGICAVFCFQIVPKSEEVDEWLWVVVGDLPPAYLVTDQADRPSDALRVYVQEMDMWVSAVETGESVEDLIPVNASPTMENALSLKKRLNTLKRFNICDGNL